MAMCKCFGYSDKAIVTELNRIYEDRIGSETTNGNSGRDVHDEEIHWATPKSEVEARAVRQAACAIRSLTKRECVRTLLKKEFSEYKTIVTSRSFNDLDADYSGWNFKKTCLYLI